MEWNDLSKKAFREFADRALSTTSKEGHIHAHGGDGIIPQKAPNHSHYNETRFLHYNETRFHLVHCFPII